MSVLELPVNGDDPNFDIQFDLDGATFTHKFRYNDRDSSWSMSIFDASGTLVRAGIRLVPNFPLNRQIASELAPKGAILLTDTRADRKGDAPTRTELGESTTLTYTEVD